MGIMEIVGILAFLIGVLGVALALYQYLKSKDQLMALQQRLEELKRERPEIQTHHVIMDGMSGSGKTTFIARLISPVTSRESLMKIAATAKNYSTLALPICWEKKTKTKNTLLHMLRFHDIAGERRSTFLNALNGLSKEDLKDTKVVSVILWDISNAEENYKYMNKQLIEVTYGNDIARTVITSVIIFFNKTDLIKDKAKLSQKLGSEKQTIIKIFQELFDKGYGDIKFYAGSAIEGNGMHYCFGEIINDLSLQHNFETITGNPFERRNENI